ncbi:MAG: class I fructose-bisphosphate aldolase [Pseudomonadota bacterium]
MSLRKLIATAGAMVVKDRGLLSKDESTTTCNKRFEKAGFPQTEEARRFYREMIVTTPRLRLAMPRCAWGTSSPASSHQVQPGCASWRIQCLDGKDMIMTTRIPQPIKFETGDTRQLMHDSSTNALIRRYKRSKERLHGRR